MEAIHSQYLLDLLARNQRADGRAFDQFRPISISYNVAPKAEGSVRLKMGKTEVIVGVKLGVGTPFADRPDEGVLIVNAELSPLASPLFELGPPREDAIEIARVVDRGIRESHAVDLAKLCITPKEKVWNINIDLYILNHDGNLIDACGLAALLTSTLPKLTKEGTIDFEAYEDRAGPLPLGALPLPVTLHKIGGKLVIDPTLVEEEAAKARLTVASTEDGRLCAMQKGGTEPFTDQEVDQAFALAVQKAAELRTHLPKPAAAPAKSRKK
ncbi:MAG TPA: exosome complex protein Rrp42 [archaeon]|nr:exosome complex protein Rrp42 [archaeon]